MTRRPGRTGPGHRCGQGAGACLPCGHAQALDRAGTAILAAMNGVPWWFSHGVSALGDEPLASVDPGGAIAAALPVAQVIGCVLHMSASTSAPGIPCTAWAGG